MQFWERVGLRRQTLVQAEEEDEEPCAARQRTGSGFTEEVVNQVREQGLSHVMVR